MTKAKKNGIVLCILVLVIGGLWFYWEWEMPLKDVIPDEEWTHLEILQGDVDSDEREREFIDPPLDVVLDAIASTKVTRDGKNPYLNDGYFQLRLYKGEVYPTLIYIKSTGEISIAAELDLDNYKYYEGGEELYEYLRIFSQTLPAVFPGVEKPAVSSQ